MPITVRLNVELELNLVEYRGAIAWEELTRLAAFGAQSPDFLRRDTLNWVHPGAHFRRIDFGKLDALFEHYRKLFAPLAFHIFRRAAWLCQSPEAQEHIRYWLVGRDTRQAMSSNVRDFSSISDAGEWLLLSQAEIARIERGEGFRELTRFEHQLGLAR